MWRHVIAVGCCIVLSLGLLACEALRQPQPYETVQPQTPPVRNLTSFSESLRCMDELFIVHGLGQQGLGAALVTSRGVIDKTGKNIGGDNLDVLVSTISTMAARSSAIKFIANNPQEIRSLDELNVKLWWHQQSRSDLIIPMYTLIAAITQLDDSVDARSFGGSVAFPYGDLGATRDSQIAVLSVDFNISETISQQVLNGMTASNTIAIRRRGLAVDGGGFVKKAGLFLNVSLDKNEGLYAALRVLIELSTLEVLGKLTKVPYWQCLQIEQSNPEVQSTTRNWFLSMPEQERVEFVQRMLNQQGFYTGSVTGHLDQATRDALARYQASANLIPSGRIDLPLYRRLLGQEWPTHIRQEAVAATTSTPVPDVAPPLILTLTTPRGPAPVYALHEPLVLSLSVSHPAYVYCYYQDAQRRISRVYPNRFQSRGMVPAGQAVTIPDTAQFTLLLDTPESTEKVLCLAVPENVEALLLPYLRVDLEVLPVQELTEVAAAFRQLARQRLGQAELSVRVHGRKL